MNVIEIKNLTKLHGRMKALDNFTVTVKENTITGLIGRNGAGKTTLLKIIAGYWHHTSGEVHVFGTNPFNNLTVSANTIFIDDQMKFHESLTLRDILDEAGKFYEKWDMDFALRLFDYFSFHPRQTHASLSKGKKSTFNMIIGLSTRSALTIFDEPTTGMDPAARSDFYRALLKDYLQHPRTMIISSHHLDEMEHLLEDVLLMDNGKKRLHLPMEELKEYAIAFEGKSEIVESWLQNKELYHRKQIGTDHIYAVVKNNFSQKALTEAKQLGMNVLPVTPSELCMHLTNKTKGGIDDVFIQD